MFEAGADFAVPVFGEEDIECAAFDEPDLFRVIEADRPVAGAGKRLALGRGKRGEVNRWVRHRGVACARSCVLDAHDQCAWTSWKYNPSSSAIRVSWAPR